MIDYEELATVLEEMREMLRAMVAGLIADGFTDEQARQIVVFFMTNKSSDDE